MPEQLLLFHYQKSDMEELNDDLTMVIEKLDRYRKSMHAKISTLSSQVRTLEARLNIQEAQLYVLKAYIETYMNIDDDKQTEKTDEARGHTTDQTLLNI